METEITRHMAFNSTNAYAPAVATPLDRLLLGTRRSRGHVRREVR